MDKLALPLWVYPFYWSHKHLCCKTVENDMFKDDSYIRSESNFSIYDGSLVSLIAVERPHLQYLNTGWGVLDTTMPYVVEVPNNAAIYCCFPEGISDEVIHSFLRMVSLRRCYFGDIVNSPVKALQLMQILKEEDVLPNKVSIGPLKSFFLDNVMRLTHSMPIRSSRPIELPDHAPWTGIARIAAGHIVRRHGLLLLNYCLNALTVLNQYRGLTVKPKG